MTNRWSQGMRWTQQQKMEKREGRRESWLTICIPFRGYQGTWLNSVRLNPLGVCCCQRPSRNPFTGTQSLAPHQSPFIFMPGLTYWGRGVKKEKRIKKGAGAGHLLFVSREVLNLCLDRSVNLDTTNPICMSFIVSICL